MYLWCFCKKNGQKVKQSEVLVQLDDYNQLLSFEKAKNSLLKSEIELKDILLVHGQNLTDTLSIPPLSY
jgi:multidrug efflux pump subunit AcrA (membrane-fusion protein)